MLDLTGDNAPMIRRCNVGVVPSKTPGHSPRDPGHVEVHPRPGSRHRRRKRHTLMWTASVWQVLLPFLHVSEVRIMRTISASARVKHAGVHGKIHTIILRTR